MNEKNNKLQTYALTREHTKANKISLLALVFLLILTMSFAWLSMGFAYASSDVAGSAENVTQDATAEDEVTDDVSGSETTTIDMEKVKSCVMILIVVVAVAAFVTKAIKICVAAIIIFVVMSAANIPIDGDVIGNITGSVGDTVKSLGQNGFFSNIFASIGEFFKDLLQQFGIAI